MPLALCVVYKILNPLKFMQAVVLINLTALNTLN